MLYAIIVYTGMINMCCSTDDHGHIMYRDKIAEREREVYVMMQIESTA